MYRTNSPVKHQVPRRGEVRDGGVGQLREEDVLGAIDHLAGNLHGTADGRLPEGQIEHVMQTEGNEQALDHAEQEHAHRTRRSPRRSPAR